MLPEDVDKEIKELLLELNRYVETVESCAGNFFRIHYFDLRNKSECLDKIRRGIEAILTGKIADIYSYPFYIVILKKGEYFEKIDEILRKYNPRVMEWDTPRGKVVGYMFLYQEWLDYRMKIMEKIFEIRDVGNGKIIKEIYEMIKDYLEKVRKIQESLLEELKNLSNERLHHSIS